MQLPGVPLKLDTVSNRDQSFSEHPLKKKFKKCILIEDLSIAFSHKICSSMQICTNNYQEPTLTRFCKNAPFLKMANVLISFMLWNFEGNFDFWFVFFF